MVKAIIEAIVQNSDTVPLEVKKKSLNNQAQRRSLIRIYIWILITFMLNNRIRIEVA